jgi:thiosulfate dehydrogenase [quinone] large subunit
MDSLLKRANAATMVALVASVVGGFLLIEAAETTNSADTALVALVLGWALLILSVVALYRRYRGGADEAAADEVPLREWRVARFLGRAKGASVLFLGLRIFLGWQWFHAGWEKFQNPAWMNGGTALRGYWERAIAVPAPPARPAITYPLYRAFLDTLVDGGHERWFTYLIVFGEMAVGIGILVGGLTAIAAFFGIVMNFSFLYAGTVSSNPTLLVLAAVLMYCWRTSGWVGLDYFLLQWAQRVWARVHHAPGGRVAADSGRGLAPA